MSIEGELIDSRLTLHSLQTPHHDRSVCDMHAAECNARHAAHEARIAELEGHIERLRAETEHEEAEEREIEEEVQEEEEEEVVPDVRPVRAHPLLRRVGGKRE